MGNPNATNIPDGSQLIYKITATAGFTAGSAYSAGQGTLLQTNTSTGAMTPIFTGMNTA
jgi:hypothetical protein